MALLACIPGVALAVRWVRAKLGLRGRSVARLCDHHDHHDTVVEKDAGG